MDADAVGGSVQPGFEAVRDAFIENFERRNELGAACCVYHRGEKVVDLWGGVRDRATGDPWEEDTMALVFSATKGISALAMALAHSRGLFDYDEPVGTYWPEFGRQGKARVTVRQLLSHQAGLHVLDQYPTRDLVADPDRLAAVLARQTPAWEPGAYQAYHGITIGFYEGELLRRVDPEHRTLGRFFQEELADPLGLDFYIRLPGEVPNARLAPLERPQRMWTMFFSMPFLLMLSGMSPRGCIRRTLEGSELPEADRERVYARDLEVPAGGGVGTARAMARAYSEFATGGAALGLREETLRALMAPAVPPAHGFRDRCLKIEIPFALGFTRPNRRDPFGHRSAFGAEGSGGSYGFADPEARLGYAYIPNQMGVSMVDPRELALRTAVWRSVGEPDPYRA
jgi:CubicO group peptidase (beta-lactamase class C family)